jgi:NAD(P)-binding Rossmann-like domain
MGVPGTGSDLEVDYVIIGAGATALSFADVVLAESDYTVALVDRHANPGGHWNDAYSFVRLHQPSAYYGVNSRPLGRNHRDVEGTNAGLFELATGQQVLTYFDDLMREQFLPTGRVTYLPMSEYLEDGTVVGALDGRRTTVSARRKVVDARYLGSVVPSVHTPSFPVHDGVAFVPINGLTSIEHPPSKYVILGAGKTGVDACLWLLEHGVNPERIRWVRPRDAWFLNRARIQPDTEMLAGYADLLESGAAAASVEDLVQRLERAAVLLRIDGAHWPTMFRVATVTTKEVDQLRKIEDVVRLGYVTSIDPGIIHLQFGDVQADDCLHVDCTAEGLRRRPPIPIFQDDRITLQCAVIDGHPTYSAALIARIELALDIISAKNDACPPVPITSELVDIAKSLWSELESEPKRARIPGLAEWMAASRLNPEHWAMSAVAPADTAAQSSIGRVMTGTEPARENLARLIGTTAA